MLKQSKKKKIGRRTNKKSEKEPKKNKLLPKKRANKCIGQITLALLGAMVYLSGNLIYTGIFKHEEYAKKVVDNMTLREREVKAPRGTIQDTYGRVLSASVMAYDIILNPYGIINEVKGDEKRQHIYETLATQLNMDAKEIEAEVKVRAAKESGNKYYLIAEKVEEKVAEPLMELLGVTVSKTYIRRYPNGELASQVLGFYNKNGKGQYGVEEGYDTYLQGIPGRSFSQIQQYEIVTSELQEPVAGDTITLTLDSMIQKYVQDAMEKYIKKTNPETATAIIMNPKTGEILAMYSYPNYDPNYYNNLTEQLGKSWEKMSQQQQSTALLSAWRNNAIQMNYEPGSTFKPLVVAMALEEGVISEEKTYLCTGSKNVSGTTIRCWKHEGHGLQTLSQALANSCNVASMDIGEEMDNSQFLGYIKDFGFGKPTGIALAGEEKGQLHTSLGPVEKATYSIGQGLTVTPIQLISAFSAVINGGYLMEPYIVSDITGANGQVVFKQEPVVKQQIISSDIANYVKEALKKVVDEGTGTNAAISGYQIGGKTGTGQEWLTKDGKIVKDSNGKPMRDDKYACSFMGFAPVEDPQIVGLVVFEKIPEGTGAQTSAFKEMMENILPYLDVPANLEGTEEDEMRLQLPNLQGKTIYEAVSILNQHELTYNILGSGKMVESQYPEAKQVWYKGGNVTLYAKTDNPKVLHKVPDLTGHTIEEAKTIVDGIFTIEGSGTGKIQSQFPKPDYELEANQKIIVQTSE